MVVGEVVAKPDGEIAIVLGRTMPLVIVYPQKLTVERIFNASAEPQNPYCLPT